jgi:hypothetical protein
MTQASIEERLAKVEAGLAIQQLPVRYAMAVDSRDMDALALLYVDDIDMGDLGRGHEALKTYFANATSIFYRSIHQILGHSYELIDEDHATGKVYCRAEHERGDTWIAAVMVYFDHYERRNGRWLFGKKREFDFFYCADILERPQAVNFQHWVVPGARMDPPMMLPRFPNWKPFWNKHGQEVVDKLTSHP